MLFVVVPIVDVCVGDRCDNPSDAEVERLSRDRYYRWCTYLYLPVNLAGLIVACYLWTQPALSLMDKVGLAITVGITGGIGINVAHELGHRIERLERWLSKVALAQPCYGHFCVEHSRGHHVHVATPEDAVSARFGESYWFFLPRSSVGGLLFALKAEHARLRRSGRCWLGIHNELIRAWSLSLVLHGVLMTAFGWRIAPYLLLQAIIGVSLLEAINYIEHYGLLRQRLPTGRYERCSPKHAWNSDRLITNLGLFHLQRHSDHHAHPSRRYQLLRSMDEAPQLPAGYASMVLLALVPRLWRRVMDPCVLAHYDGDISRTNLVPALRKRYGHAPLTLGTV
ncbi:alkane 1-monooxygenase [Mycobacterium hubeiense]|uniref:alkane 1-monooxygenase n=1 Tax=Mycobacterium hubeiense TaxID=1867256 RepID=UPI0027D23EC5|nr:alkane 1-monooxygenase [Mycobacterium sp. QGD 101]